MFAKQLEYLVSGMVIIALMTSIWGTISAASLIMLVALSAEMNIYFMRDIDRKNFMS